MKKYEAMYILKADLEETARKELMDSMHNIITTNGGTIDNVDEWGIKDFAYEIDHMTKGYYVVVKMTAENTGLNEFDRLMRINNNVVRHMIIAEEEK